MNKPHVVIQYPFIPLYRIPIFQKLSASTRYDYTFLASRASPDKFLKSAFADSGLKIEEVALSTLRIPIINKALELQFSAIAKLVKHRPDVYIILANPNSLSSWACMLVARLMGSVVLAWSHGFLSDEKGLKGWLRSVFYRLAHGYLLYGNRAKDIMIRKGFDPDKIDVIYNSLDYTKQSALRDKLDASDRSRTRARLGIPENSIVLLSIGRLVAKLKLDQTIESVRKLNAEGKNVYLLIIGDGPEKKTLGRQAEFLAVKEHVIFYGACHNENELSLLYNACDLSIAMGKVGLSVMHSLAYGVPMLTNNTIEAHGPEIEAIIEGKTGWLFDEDNISSFVSKVARVPYHGIYYRECIKVVEDHYTPDKQFFYIERAIEKHFQAPQGE